MLPKITTILTLLGVGLYGLVEARTPYPKRTPEEQVLPEKLSQNTDHGSISPKDHTFPLPSENRLPFSPEGGTFSITREQLIPFPPEGRIYPLQSEQHLPIQPLPSEQIPQDKVNGNDKGSILISGENKHSFNDKSTNKYTRLPISNRKAPAAASSFHQEIRTPFSLSSSSECGHINTRIVNGQETGLHEYPWMVWTLLEWKNGSGIVCGGTIIHPQWILTASHCINEFYYAPRDSYEIFVTVGAHYTNSSWKHGENIAEVDFFITHGMFWTEGAPFDIAVYKLVRPLVFTQNVAPICLAPKSWREKDFEGLDLTITGWGITESGELSTYLRELTTVGYNYDACSKMYSGNKFSPRWNTNQICTDASTQKFAGSGDSGGPVMFMEEGRAYQVGIVSFGCDYCGGTVPDVHIRVANFFDWIEAAMKY